MGKDEHGWSGGGNNRNDVPHQPKATARNRKYNESGHQVASWVNPMHDEFKKAAFAGGCFWHVEADFRNIKGVVDTVVEYEGGTFPNPKYEDTHDGKTGHAETVEITFDPKIVSYDKLLDAFWEMIDPTALNRQGPDKGSQYRSVIFYFDEEQKRAAEESKSRLGKSGKYGKPIVTEIVQASKFWKAEEYHQRYFEKHGLRQCRM